MTELPSATAHLDAIRSIAAAKRLVMLVDDDGTLTPIVARPEDVILSDTMRCVLSAVAWNASIIAMPMQALFPRLTPLLRDQRLPSSVQPLPDVASSGSPISAPNELFSGIGALGLSRLQVLESASHNANKRGRDMSLLENKVAIITGASKGIGRVLSLCFAREGASVICAARSAELVQETVQLVQDAGGHAIAVTCDATDEDDVQRMIAAGVDAFGKITTLINNAGDGGPTKPVEDYTMDDWFYTLNSCLTTSYICTRFVVPVMVKAGGGSIVNISSGAGRQGLPYRIGYCSAKAGQVGMTYGMALELGPRGIRVNCVAPGAVAGDRIDRVIVGQAEQRGIGPEEMRQEMLARLPLGEMTTAEDIANGALFFASDLSTNVSGQVLAVNGGEPAG